MRLPYMSSTPIRKRRNSIPTSPNPKGIGKYRLHSQKSAPPIVERLVLDGFEQELDRVIGHRDAADDDHAVGEFGEDIARRVRQKLGDGVDEHMALDPRKPRRGQHGEPEESVFDQPVGAVPGNHGQAPLGADRQPDIDDDDHRKRRR